MNLSMKEEKPLFMKCRIRRKILFGIAVFTMINSGCSSTANDFDKMQETINYADIQSALSDVQININSLEKTNETEQNKEEFVSESRIVADFLQMSSEEFPQKYDRNELYKRNILYCDMDAWKYQGNQLDAFQDEEDYYDVVDICAIRFRNPSQEMNIFDDNDWSEIDSEYVDIKGMGDFAVSIYNPEGSHQEKNDGLEMAEISFIKVELEEGTAPEALYYDLESGYYRVREEIQKELWIPSPDGSKSACVSNGSLSKHPSQIFIRYEEEIPDRVFRETWECGIVGWIDEEHLVCYLNDWSPMLIHLENDQVEVIRNKDDDFDAYGAKYRLESNHLICECLGEEICRWNIVSENNDILFVKDEIVK